MSLRKGVSPAVWSISGLEVCGRELSRKCYIEAFQAPEAMDVDGFQLEYGPNDSQGSDAAPLTVTGEDGEYHPFDMLGGAK